LFDLGTAAGPGKELRVDRINTQIVERRDAAWNTWYADVARERWASAGWHTAGWGLFALAYICAVVWVASGRNARPGQVALALAAGANLPRYLGVTAGQAEFLRWTLDAAQRLAWLEQYAATVAGEPDQPVPDQLTGAIRFEQVSFRYPGTDAWVLRDVTV